MCISEREKRTLGLRYSEDPFCPMAKEFFCVVRKALNAYNLSLTVTKTKNLEYEGIFDPTKGIVLYIHNWNKSPCLHDWFPTLVHEYCHFVQWAYSPDFWEKYITEPELSSFKNVSPRRRKDLLKKEAYKWFILELDCEKRTEYTLNMLGYPKQLTQEYVQKAWFILLLYKHIYLYPNCQINYRKNKREKPWQMLMPVTFFRKVPKAPNFKPWLREKTNKKGS